MIPVLEVRNLAVSYGGDAAVAVSSLALQPGTLSGVVGANGAGKSTLVNAIAGWSRAAPRVSGSVLLDGEDVGSLPAHEHVRRGLLLVPEGHGVFLGLSVEENLRAVRSPPSSSVRRAFSVDEVYDLFPRLRERRANAAGSMSGGERQMLAMARALRLGPRVLLLDEPSIGLAPRLVITLLQAVRRLVDAGMTVLLVEQNVRAAVEVVDTLHLLERGRMIASGPVAAMKDDPRIIEAYLGASHG
ncbi:ABC transporter ATP-binding protein [Acidisphaera sp. L21]|uniref:ABC transporter ATP-binding protein n=1 Tax=Acidisphaera sp. L21 TaxID=1641851 RepID=UPI00131BF0FD|nr:ABC transporter ATP-binding protein [Acidisphaera sp. L21]